MVVALLALFVALDGPATAARSASRLLDGKSIKANSITSAKIRNRTLGVQDLSKRAITTLQATPVNGVASSQLRDGAVTGPKIAAKAVDGGKLGDGAVGNAALGAKAVDGGKIADGAVGGSQLAADAVTASKLADGSVGAAAIADGNLQTTDVGDFYGVVSVDFIPFAVNECQVASIDNPTPTGNPMAQVADDVITVSPVAGFSDLIVVTANPGAGNTIRIVACRVGKNPPPADPYAPLDPGPTTFRYLGIDAP
jgi:hypothetical protein